MCIRDSFHTFDSPQSRNLICKPIKTEIIAADIEFGKRFSENKFGITCSFVCTASFAISVTCNAV